MSGGEDGVGQLAHTLQSCLELTEPVQQIQLVKKVCFCVIFTEADGGKHATMGNTVLFLQTHISVFAAFFSSSFFLLL